MDPGLDEVRASRDASREAECEVWAERRTKPKSEGETPEAVLVQQIAQDVDVQGTRKVPPGGDGRNVGVGQVLTFGIRTVDYSRELHEYIDYYK